MAPLRPPVPPAPAFHSPVDERVYDMQDKEQKRAAPIGGVSELL
jgi:hypothetical protein